MREGRKMQILFNYNFNPEDIVDLNFEALYEKRRRDSCFAFAFEKNDEIYALRDHFGIVPLYFSWRGKEIFFSTTLDPLITPESKINLQGYKAYIAFETVRLLPLFEDIGIVPPGSVIKISKRNKQAKLVYIYRFKRHKFSRFCRMNEMVELLDHLLLQAVKRTAKYNKVGLYFSGIGADSLITAVYLAKCGIEVNAYTCSRWGDKGSEMQYAPKSARRVGVKNLFVDALNSEKVRKSLDKIIEIYKIPKGDTASIGVTSLWLHTPIGEEKQIYGAQGADTINCAMGIQNIAYISSFLPGFIRRKISNNLSDDMIDNYIRICSKGLLNLQDMPPIIRNIIQTVEGKIQKLSIAGMLICHTPGDSEVLSAPVINSNVLYSNLFYDVDVAEFFLGLDLRHRLNFTFSFKELLDKLILRKLAKEYQEPEVRKLRKGFNIPLHIYGVNKELERFKPPIDIPNDVESKFSAFIFSKYCKSRTLNISFALESKSRI